MATLIDIAKKTGFSKTLVARAINNEPGVSEKSRKAILEVAKELNYRPNLLAKAMITNKMNTISVVLDSLCEPFYFKLIEAIETTAALSDVKVLFCSPNDDLETKKKYIEYFTQGTTDGIIIYGSRISDETYIKSLASTNFPLVVIESDIDSDNINKVLIDNYNASRTAIKYLVNQKCKSIYHFRGDAFKSVSDDRCQGYINEMENMGLKKYIKILDSDFTEQSGYKAMTQLIMDNDIPEAIFFAGDTTAYGALRAIEELNQSLKTKIRFIGFDEDQPPNNGIIYPRLSTIRQPMYEIGRTATQILLEQIKDKEKKPKIQVLIPELVIKET